MTKGKNDGNQNEEKELVCISLIPFSIVPPANANSDKIYMYSMNTGFLLLFSTLSSLNGMSHYLNLIYCDLE